MYKYTFRVQYQEIDAERRLRLHALQNHILSIAGLAADEGGFGIQYLYPQGLTWIITNMSLEMDFMPQAGDEILVETWVEQNQHMLSIRNYKIYTSSPVRGGLGGSLIGRAKTVWAILDLTKREIVNVFDQAPFQGVAESISLDLARPSRMLPLQTQVNHPHTIQYGDVDYNNHCNSCKYTELMLNVNKPEWLSKGFRFDIKYAKEIYLGDTLYTFVEETDSAVNYQQKDASGTTLCSARIEKR
ncbi:MAG: thioesterase [Paludibacteraceae bacterium]|nr:thioesterase [Paludibacteraceae bacterium]